MRGERTDLQDPERSRKWHEKLKVAMVGNQSRRGTGEFDIPYPRTDPRYGKERHYRAYHGITLAQYDKMLVAQGGKCAICGEGPKKNSLAVDHDHETGKIRGLLCYPCNIAVGRVERYREKVLAWINKRVEHGVPRGTPLAP